MASSAVCRTQALQHCYLAPVCCCGCQQGQETELPSFAGSVFASGCSSD